MRLYSKYLQIWFCFVHKAIEVSPVILYSMFQAKIIKKIHVVLSLRCCMPDCVSFVFAHKDLGQIRCFLVVLQVYKSPTVAGISCSSGACLSCFVGVSLQTGVHFDRYLL